MKVFIDTAVKGCNIALFDDDQIIFIAQEPIERGHAETLLLLFQNHLEQNNYNPKDIQEIYVTVGPGSFTGLRVGLTVAEFMGFTLQKPVFGITTFQAFSCGVDQECDRAVVIETKRSDYYYQSLNSNHEAISEAQSISADFINIPDNSVLTGDAVDRFVKEKNMDCEHVQQDMIDVAAVIKAIQAGQFNFHDPQAFYIRDADVSQSKK
jgi:tRNA threonylcarbamoyladenosine biosynthesis protein TsaB